MADFNKESLGKTFVNKHTKQKMECVSVAKHPSVDLESPYSTDRVSFCIGSPVSKDWEEEERYDQLSIETLKDIPVENRSREDHERLITHHGGDVRAYLLSIGAFMEDVKKEKPFWNAANEINLLRDRGSKGMDFELVEEYFGNCRDKILEDLETKSPITVLDKEGRICISIAEVSTAINKRFGSLQ